MEEERKEITEQEGERKGRNQKWLLLLIPVLIFSLIFGHQSENTKAEKALFLHETYKKDPAMDENGIFLIDTVEDYLRFCGYVNRGVIKKDGGEQINAALTADIDLDDGNIYKPWTDDPYKYTGYWVTEYGGTFEGNNHTLKGYESGTDEASMFVVLKEGGVIRNLNLEDVNVVISEYSAGGLCKYNYGLIENCSVTGLVKSPRYTGGIAGFNSGTIKNCVNRAKVVSTNKEDFFGAGGIAGKNERGQKALDREADPLIINCTNSGEVDGFGLAGGICAMNRYSQIKESKNEGPVTVNVRRLTTGDGISFDSLAAGICGDLRSGTIEACYNTGSLSIKEDSSSDTFGIAGNMFGISSKVINCVNLKGTANGSMRHESIMEVTEEELELWKTGVLPYISNNWQFSLDEAMKKLSLSPLGIEESALSSEKQNIYLCGDFGIRAPAGYEISTPSPYALCIQPGADEAAANPESAGHQVWLMKLGEAIDVNQLLSEEGRTDQKTTASEVFHQISGSHYFFPSNLGSFSDQNIEYLPNGIFLTKYRDTSMRFYLEEGDEIIDNIISLPLSYTDEGGYEAKWLLLFTDQFSNYRPQGFYKKILQEFHFLPITIIVKKGDTLSQLAATYTGDGSRWRELLLVNELLDANRIEIGQRLLVPEIWLLDDK